VVPCGYYGKALPHKPVEIEFDPDKDARNIRARGLSLRIAGTVLNNLIGEAEDFRRNYGEKRKVAFGWAFGHIMCVVYTRRGDAYRIISLRRAKAKEVRKWLGSERNM
jgi:uncharacterized DUF497 family protein